jgi:hypothetical protein
MGGNIMSKEKTTEIQPTQIRRMKMSEEKTEWWAVVRWSIDDIKKVKPKWTNQECHDFLQLNEKHMRDRMIETGWDIIDILIQEEVTS